MKKQKQTITRTITTKPSHRPRKELDLARVTELARTMATEREMAVMSQMDYTTWKRRKRENPKVQEAIDAGRAKGCFSLRAAQMQSALRGNVQMMKWCGMQYLDQKHNMQHGGDPQNPLPTGTTQHVFNFADAEAGAAAFDAWLRESRAKKKD